MNREDAERFGSRNRDAILVEAARKRLVNFAKWVNPKLSIQPFHLVYYQILDMFAHGKIKKLIVQMPPQHGKSEGSSRNLPAFMLGLDPDLKICIGSYSATIARDFNRDVQRIIDTEDYAKVFPETRLNGSNVVTITSSYLRNSDVFECVGHKGGLRVVGRGGSLTSKTVDISILDDVYKDFAEGNSPIIREAAWRWYTSVVRTRLHNQSQELIVFTRWHEDDLIGRIEKSGEKIIDAKKWEDLENIPPAAWVRINFEALKESEQTEFDGRQIGEALWEDRHSKRKLEDQKKLDPTQFQCLFQGNPSSAEGRLYHPFKTYVDKAEYGKLIRTGCYVDVADEGSDFLAAATYEIYQSENQFFNEKTKRFEPILYALITDIEYTEENTDVTTITIPAMINRNGVQRAWIESNNGGSQFEKIIRRKVRCNTIPFHQSQNKEARITTASAMVNQSIIFPLGWQTRWPKAYEDVTAFLRYFKGNAHDDMCFVAGTKIATIFGNKPIEQIKKGDYVLTPYGYRKVIASEMTGKREVIKRFGLQGTKNHPIFQQKSFDELAVSNEELLSLLNIKNLQLWRYKKLLCSMVLNTNLWGREGIIFLNQTPIREGKVQKDCMWRFGNFIAERSYLKAIVFITRMAMCTTMTLVIWNAFRVGNIYKCIRERILRISNIAREIGRILIRQGQKQVNGIDRKKAENGIGKIHCQEIGVQNSTTHASTAERHSNQCIGMQNSAAMDAEKNIENQNLDTSAYASAAESNSNMAKGSLRNQTDNSAHQVVGQDTPIIKEVYNLNVDDAHCYYANGILVSNCDMLTGIYEKEIADGNTKAYFVQSHGVRVR
jgi:predicted phage terminase large subunit-like protein